MDIEERAHLTKLRCAHVKRLRVLELKQAKMGLHAPEHIFTELDDLSEKIADIDIQLNGAAVPSVCPPGSTDAPLMVQVDIVFKGDFDTLTPDLQERMVRVLAAFVDLSPEQIRVIKAMSGSIILRVEMSKEAADRLLELYKSQDPAVEDAEIADIRAVQAQATISPDTPDEELVSQLNNGNDEAFRLLYDRYYSRVSTIVLRLLGDASLVEDVVQDTFIRAFSALHQYDPLKGSFSRWLLMVAKNSALAMQRRSHAGYQVSLLESVIKSEADLGERFVEVFGQLSERDRRLIELRFFSGLSYKEIAQMTGDQPGVVRARLFRALKKVRKSLSAEG